MPENLPGSRLLELAWTMAPQIAGSQLPVHKLHLPIGQLLPERRI